MARPVDLAQLSAHRMRRALLLALGFSFGLSLYACGTMGQTPTPSPSPPSPTPPPDIHAILGTRLFHDDFSEDQGWDLGSDALGASSLEAGRLVLALHQASAFRYVLVPDVAVGDFYLEVILRTELCGPNDEFGVLVRFTPDGEYYRIGLYCDGRARGTRVLQGSSIAPIRPPPPPPIVPLPPPPPLSLPASPCPAPAPSATA